MSPHGLPIPRVERGERHAPGPARALQPHEGAGGGEHRQRVAGGRRVGHVAADGAAILNLHAADFARGRSQHRQAATHQRRPDQIAVRRQRPDGEGIAAAFDLPQGIQPPQVEEPRALQRTEIEGDVEIGAPRHRHERLLLAQHVQCVAQRLWLEQATMRECRLHHCPR